MSNNPAGEHLFDMAAPKAPGGWDEHTALRILEAHLVARGCSEEEVVLASEHARSVEQVCQDIGLDDDGLNASILQVGLPFNRKERESLKKQVSVAIMELLDGVHQMQSASAFSSGNQGEVSEENLRKMLIAMVNDVRVVLIRLADQVVLMREIKNAPEAERSEAAQLTLDVYARLANRLGVWHLKWELEDYSLRYLEPAAYHSIAAELAEKRGAREQYIETFIHALEDKLRVAGIGGQVYGRPKHIYSIWKKMQAKGLAFENIMDIRAVRVLVENVEDCYRALGVVHRNWQYLPGEFDDYIATPKPNGYQSIHTAVIGEENKVVEVQIRTQAMHEENELGIAAHWRYKEHSGQDSSIDQKIQWLRQLLEWKDDMTGEQFQASFAEETSETTVYVFSPRGKVIDLPAGSTPIDFAYAIHTEVGHKTRGARVNGKMVPLSTPLKTGDQVEIITAKLPQPSRDWVALPGFVATHRARSRVLQWFKAADRDQHIAAGRDIVERALRRSGVADLAFERLAERHNYASVEDMFAALGAGDVKFTKLISPFRRERENQQRLEVLPAAKAASTPVARRDADKRSGALTERPGEFVVKGVGNLKTQLANCCNPVPGEPILGFITRGRGITVHRQSCANMQHLQETDLRRVIDVEWGLDRDSSYPVLVAVVAYNRQGILHDITKVLNDAKQTFSKAILETDENESVVKMTFTLEVGRVSDLSKIFNQLEQVPNVLEVNRLSS